MLRCSRCTWEAADTVDAEHINEYRKRLDLRVSEQARSTELQLPLELATYVPQKLLLKDYQIEGGVTHLAAPVECEYW